MCVCFSQKSSYEEDSDSDVSAFSEESNHRPAPAVKAPAVVPPPAARPPPPSAPVDNVSLDDERILSLVDNGAQGGRKGGGLLDSSNPQLANMLNKARKVADSDSEDDSEAGGGNDDWD